MRTTLSALFVLAALAGPAFAADQQSVQPAPPHAHNGDILRDSNNIRLGQVNSVNKDGSVGIIYNSRYIVVPGDLVSVVNGKLVTTLTKHQLEALGG